MCQCESGRYATISTREGLRISLQGRQLFFHFLQLIYRRRRLLLQLGRLGRLPLQRPHLLPLLGHLLLPCQHLRRLRFRLIRSDRRLVRRLLRRGGLALRHARRNMRRVRARLGRRLARPAAELRLPHLDHLLVDALEQVVRRPDAVARQDVVREHLRHCPRRRVELLQDRLGRRRHEGEDGDGEDVDEVDRARDDLRTPLRVGGHQRLVQARCLQVQVAPRGQEHDRLEAKPELDGLHGVDVVLQMPIDLRNELCINVIIGGERAGDVATVGNHAIVLRCGELQDTVDEVTETK